VADDGGMFRATFYDSPIGIAILDEVGHYVEVNRAFAAILGREPDECVSRNFAEFTHPSDLPRDIELLSQLARKDFPYYQTQKRYVTGDGDTRWARITVTRIDDETRTASHHFIAQIEDVTEVLKAREQLERRAFYDALTGLANRALLMDRITAAIGNHRKRDTTVALIFFDIDDFKQVNDSLGHSAGDHLLTIIAQRLQSAVRRGDTVARYGGDEFVVLLEGVQSQENAEALASIITRAVQAPVTIANHEVVPTVSAGLAIADGDIDAEGLLGDADTAMYAAKKSGHATLKIYDTALREQAVTKMEIEEGLRKALREGELTVYYQPVVDLESRSVTGYESLVRWSHPRRGFLLPQEFLAVAEQAHLVEPIGSHVIHEACEFVDRHPTFDGRVFINVSPRQIGTASLAHTLDAAFKDHGVEPSRFIVEITEAGFLKTSLAADADLARIAELGVGIVLDDFGTGYGSLATVLEKPIAGIKLAEEFTRRLGDHGVGDKVSRGVALLAQDIGLLAVVKGVETKAQATLALSHGWTMGQGYLFGHPQAENDLGLD
jgi:diguanylate cyclase (GGDEF)-like protein/PAS domain S-box-containing protein